MAIIFLLLSALSYAAQGADIKAGSLEDILSRCSPAARRAFMQSIVLADGMMAGADYGPIAGCLDEESGPKLDEFFNKNCEVNQHHKCIAGRCEQLRANRCTCRCGTLPAGAYVAIAELTKGCSRRDRDKFLDSLVFVDGRLENQKAAPCAKRAARK